MMLYCSLNGCRTLQLGKLTQKKGSSSKVIDPTLLHFAHLPHLGNKTVQNYNLGPYSLIQNTSMQKNS